MILCNSTRVLTTNDVLKIKQSEIEDLIPAALIIQVLDRQERRAETDFEDVYVPGQSIVPQIKSWARNEGFDLKLDWKVSLAVGVKEKLLSNPDKHVGKTSLEAWAVLFEKFFPLEE